MERDQVISVLDSLAEGQPPFVVEALETAKELLRSRDRPALAGKRWTDAEDATLCEEFDAARPLAEIARKHGRTSGAIVMRLVKLGRLDPSAVSTRERGARVVTQ